MNLATVNDLHNEAGRDEGRETPRRYQQPPRHQRKGWRKPDGARMVTRPHRWSNPHPIGQPCPVERCAGVVHDRPGCVAAFEADLLTGTLRTYRKGRPVDEPHGVAEARAELAGLDLVCACGPDELCHADVLLDVVTPTDPTVLTTVMGPRPSSIPMGRR